MLETRGGILGEYPDLAEHADPVATTWSVSFDQVAQKNDLAPAILSFCAFLSAEAIPLELFTEGPEALTDDPALLWEALAVLRNYSLVKHNPATRTLSIHRLVQIVLLDELSAQERSQWSERVLLALKVLFPDGTMPSWPRCERLLPHLLAAADFFPAESGNLDLAECLQKAAGYLIGRTQFAEAERSFRPPGRSMNNREIRTPTTMSSPSLFWPWLI